MSQNGERRLVGVRVAVCLALLAGGVTPVLAQDKAQPVPPEPKGATGVPRFNPRANPALKGNQPKGNPAAQPNPNKGAQPGANPPANKPGGEGPKEHVEVPKIDAGDGMVEFSGFAEPLELSSLVEIVGATLDINIYTDGELRGSIVFNAPVKVKKEKLLDMLRAWLELYGYAIVYDERTDFYAVMPANKVPVDFNDKLSTRVWPMDGIRPSSLKTVIDGVVGAASSTVVGGGGAAGAARNARNPGNPQAMPDDGSGQAGGPQTTNTNTGGRITYHDELGMIIAVDTHRRLDQIDEVLKRVKSEYQEITIQEFSLTVVSPSVAKTRILEMLGQAPQQANQNRNRGYDEYGNPIQQQQQQNTAKTTIDNLAERLTVAPNGNSLFFRGKKNEGDLVKKLIDLIDQPSRLEPWTYYVGPAAKAVADIARQRGLGEVTVIQSMDERRMAANAGYYYYDGGYRGNQQQQQQTNISGGSVMVVDEGRGQIIYYATEKLHDEFWKLLEQIDPENEAVVMREYRLVHAKAKNVANLVLGLIQNRTIENSSGNDLLPGTNSGGGRSQQPTVVFNGPDPYGRGNNDLSISGKDSYVLADEDNNQVIVKAPVKEQSYYKELIRRIDLPRPQIYVDAQIVAVTGSDTFRLAFETQLINANGTGGVINTNFGLSSFATNGTINSPKVVSTGLKGLTAALIKSDQVPVVINALQTVTDAKVLSSPQLLVDANAKESSVESNDSQPTATRTLGNNGNQDSISFGSYEKAGTKLVVKEPRVGTGDTVQMTVEVELSSFTGSATDTLPPPKSENNIKSQVQVPANMTCVIGGVVVDSRRQTVTKIPLLGDIPLLGALFSDQGHTDSKTTLYVFLTPRVLRSATFDDVPLITSGPMKAVGIDPRTPTIKPVLVDFVSVTENPGGAPTVKSMPAAEMAKEMPAETTKAGESKPAEAKPAENKPAEAKPEGSK